MKELVFLTEQEANAAARAAVKGGIKTSYVRYQDGNFVVTYEDTE